MPRFVEHDKNSKELDREISELHDALKNGKPINIATQGRTETRLGDETIEICTLFPILNKLAEENGYPTPTFCHVPYYYRNETSFYSISQIKEVLHKIVKYEPFDVATLNKTVFSNVLGVEVPFPYFSQIQRVPGSQYFGNFSRERVNEMVQAILSEYGPRIATVTQTGSEKIKKWSADQVIQVFEGAQPYFNQNSMQGVILSDAYLANDILSLAKLTEYGKKNKVPVIFFDSNTGIELLTAFMGCTELSFKSDSAPQWVWCAEQSGKVAKGESTIIETRSRLPYKKHFSNSRALIHHVLTDNFWAAPGADCYHSEPIQNYGRRASDGFLPDFDREYRDMYRIRGEAHCPAQEDFEDYLDEQSRFLKTL